MTEVSKMTDQQLNRELAELMGYKQYGPYDALYFTSPDGSKMGVFMPASDPAASLEIQAAAYKVNPKRYLHYLAIVVNQDDLTLEDCPQSFEVYGYELVGLMVTDTPRQRAEAAYLTLREVTS